MTGDSDYSNLGAIPLTPPPQYQHLALNILPEHLEGSQYVFAGYFQKLLFPLGRILKSNYGWIPDLVKVLIQLELALSLRLRGFQAEYSSSRQELSVHSYVPYFWQLTIVSRTILDQNHLGGWCVPWQPTQGGHAQLSPSGNFCILAPEGRRGFSDTAKEPQWPHLYTSYEATYGLLCLVLKIFTKKWFTLFGATQIFDESLFCEYLLN